MAEKKIIDLTLKRKQKNLKKILKIIRIPIVILAVLAALFLSARLVGNVALSNVTDGIRQIKTLFSHSDGYPYTPEAFDYKKITSVGNYPMIIYKNSTEVLDGSARELFEMPLVYTDSKVISKNGRAVVYSNSANEVILQSKTEKLGTVNESGNVFAAALAKNGSFATSCASNEYQSVLSVYNSRFKKIFQWNCSQERIADISISNSGKRVALVAVGAENAEIYTRLLVFNTHSGETEVDMRYNGTLFLRVVLTSSNKIIAVGDNRAAVLNIKGETVDELVYSEDSLCAVCADESGNTVVCYKEFGGSKTGIVRYSSSGKKTCSFTVDGTPDCVAASGGKTAVANEKEITVYSSRGKQIKTIEANAPISEMLICSGKIYALEGGSLVKH